MKNNIEINSIVKYLPEPGSWIGIVKNILKSSDETKIKGHTSDVYIIQDMFGTASIATSEKNLLKSNYNGVCRSLK